MTTRETLERDRQIAVLERAYETPGSGVYRCTWCEEYLQRCTWSGELFMRPETIPAWRRKWPGYGTYMDLDLRSRELLELMRRRRRLHEQRGRRVLYFEITSPGWKKW